MTSKNIEVQESCDSLIESTVPEHLDAGINNGDDSFDSFETWVSAESEFNNTSGDLMETSQSCVVTGSIPIPITIFSELHHIFLTSER